MAVKFTEEQLNTFDKSLLIKLLVEQQEQNEKFTVELHDLNEKLQLIMEQLVLSNRKRFGTSSEKMEIENKICFFEKDGTICFFNESETVCDLSVEEPDDLEPKPARKKKRSGKKEEDLFGLLVNVISHYMSEDDLTAEFGEKTHINEIDNGEIKKSGLHV